MKELREFDIAIARLGNKKHLYDWNVGDNFFKYFPGSPIEKANFKIALEIEKSETLLLLEFKMEGLLGLVCDRSLEDFDQSFNSIKKLILKFGEVPGILTDEIEIIDRDEQVINVAQYIYEFVCLAVPMKKIHPRFTKEAESDNPQEENLLIYSSNEENEEIKGEEIIDPRWESLKKLKK